MMDLDKTRLARARESIEDLEADLLHYKDLYTAQINKVSQLESKLKAMLCAECDKDMLDCRCDDGLG